MKLRCVMDVANPQGEKVPCVAEFDVPDPCIFRTMSIEFDRDDTGEWQKMFMWSPMNVYFGKTSAEAAEKWWHVEEP